MLLKKSVLCVLMSVVMRDVALASDDVLEKYNLSKEQYDILVATIINEDKQSNSNDFIIYNSFNNRIKAEYYEKIINTIENRKDFSSEVKNALLNLKSSYAVLVPYIDFDETIKNIENVIIVLAKNENKNNPNLKSEFVNDGNQCYIYLYGVDLTKPLSEEQKRDLTHQFFHCFSSRNDYIAKNILINTLLDSTGLSTYLGVVEDIGVQHYVGYNRMHDFTRFGLSEVIASTLNDELESGNNELVKYGLDLADIFGDDVLFRYYVSNNLTEMLTILANQGYECREFFEFLDNLSFMFDINNAPEDAKQDMEEYYGKSYEQTEMEVQSYLRMFKEGKVNLKRAK